MNKRKQKRDTRASFLSETPGFTIVELLVVIVILGILATLIIVAYNGIIQRANKATISAALSETTKRLELDKVDRGTYATSLDNLMNSQSTPPANSKVALTFTSDGATYCLSGTLDTTSYHVDSSSSVVQNNMCAGQGPSSTQIAYTATSSFNITTSASGNVIDIPVNFNLQPTDYVVVLFNAAYNTTFSFQATSSITPSALLDKSMGSSGYQAIRIYGASGFTGSQTLHLNVCWTYCGISGVGVGAAYIVSVVRGVGASPTVTSSSTSYGSSAGSGTVVTVPSQQVTAGSVSLFTYTYYGGAPPTLSDASSPSQSWTFDATRTNPSYSWSDTSTLTQAHVVASSSTSVSYKLTMTSGTNYYGASILTLTP